MPLSRRRPEDKSEVWHPRKSVRLYLDDVDEVLAVLKQMAPYVKATTPDFVGELTTAEELKVAGQRTLSHLVLSAGNDDHEITVDLQTPVSVRIVPRDALDVAGASQKVQEVLSSRQERFGGWYLRGAQASTLAGFTLLMTLLAFITNVMASYLESTSDVRSDSQVSGWFWVAGGAILLAMVIMLVWGKLSGPNQRPQATVVLAYRADAPTWWERNRTSVLIGLFTNVGTGLLFFLLGLWLGGE